jgi:hypothetical protein
MSPIYDGRPERAIRLAAVPVLTAMASSLFEYGTEVAAQDFLEYAFLGDE